MKLKNKNVHFLNLHEEIIHVAGTVGGESHPIVFLIVGSFAYIMILRSYVVVNGTNSPTFWFILTFLLISFIWLLYFTNRLVIDRFYTDIVFTNQRLIILKKNNINPIPYNQIKRAYYGFRGGRKPMPRPAIIELNNEKSYKIYYFDGDELRTKLEEIYPEYYDDDSGLSSQTKDQINGLVVYVIILIILGILVIGYGVKL